MVPQIFARKTSRAIKEHQSAPGRGARIAKAPGGIGGIRAHAAAGGDGDESSVVKEKARLDDTVENLHGKTLKSQIDRQCHGLNNSPNGKRTDYGRLRGIPSCRHHSHLAPATNICARPEVSTQFSTSTKT